MGTTSNQESKGHYLQSSGLNLKTFLLAVMVLFVGVFSGLKIARLAPDLIFVIPVAVVALVLFLDTFHGLFVIVIAFPLLVGFSADVGVAEQVYAFLFGAWFLGWVARWLLDRSGKLSFGWHPVAKPALVMGALLVISSTVGLLNGVAFIDMLRDLSQYVGYLIVLPVLGVIRSRKAAWFLLTILLLIGLPAFMWSSFIWWARKFGVVYGTLDISMVGSAYMGPVIGALWPLVLLKTGWRKRLLAASAIFLLLLFTLGAGYRGRIISMLVMACVAIWSVWTIQTGKSRAIVAVPFIVGAFFLFLIIGGIQGDLPLPGGERTRTLYASLLSPQLLLQDFSIQGRLLEAQAALEVFREHPIIGQGLGHRLEHLRWDHTWVQGLFHYHVGYTEILMKFGIVGAIVFVWYFGSILRFAFVAAKKVDDHLTKAIALGIFIWIVASLATAVVGSPFSNRGFTFVLGLMAGMLPALVGWHPYAPAKATTKSMFP